MVATFFFVFFFNTESPWQAALPPTPTFPCFLTNNDGLTNLGRGSPKEHCQIIPNNIEIGPEVSDEKIFIFFILFF